MEDKEGEEEREMRTRREWQRYWKQREKEDRKNRSLDDLSRELHEKEQTYEQARNEYREAYVAFHSSKKLDELGHDYITYNRLTKEDAQEKFQHDKIDEPFTWKIEHEFVNLCKLASISEHDMITAYSDYINASTLFMDMAIDRWKETQKKKPSFFDNDIVINEAEKILWGSFGFQIFAHMNNFNDQADRYNKDQKKKEENMRQFIRLVDLHKFQEENK
jgi:hypothetical protein